MSTTAIFTMIVCLGGVIGGFIYFLSRAIKLEKDKEKIED